MGLMIGIFRTKLQQIVSHLDSTTPEEMARMLLRLALTANENAVYAEIYDCDKLIIGETNE